MNYTKIITLLFCLALWSCAEVQKSDTTMEKETKKSTDESPILVSGKESTIYTTASDTSLRLTQQGKQHSNQPSSH
jgi:hypothetical protein